MDLISFVEGKRVELFPSVATVLEEPFKKSVLEEKISVERRCLMNLSLPNLID
jgi:hypothetical protein